MVRVADASCGDDLAIESEGLVLREFDWALYRHHGRHSRFELATHSLCP